MRTSSPILLMSGGSVRLGLSANEHSNRGCDASLDLARQTMRRNGSGTSPVSLFFASESLASLVIALSRAGIAPAKRLPSKPSSSRLVSRSSPSGSAPVSWFVESASVLRFVSAPIAPRSGPDSRNQ